MKLPTALTIAGSDTIGGAGIQADIKTMTVNGVYAMSVITALTAQNTMGVTGVLDVPPEFLEKQLDAVFADIVPDAVKIGMTSSASLIRVITDRLALYEAKNIVLDPVMISTSGSRLISDEAVEVLKSRLLPICTLVTPNIPEAEVLSGLQIRSREDMVRAAAAIYEKFGCAVLLKGGHAAGDADDLLFQSSLVLDSNGLPQREYNPDLNADGLPQGEGHLAQNLENQSGEENHFSAALADHSLCQGTNTNDPAENHENGKISICKGKSWNGDTDIIWYHAPRIENPNTHGTGCTLSSAIAAYLARGCDLEIAVGKAKEYVAGAIAAMLNIGKGPGPLDHGYQVVRNPLGEGDDSMWESTNEAEQSKVVYHVNMEE